MRNVVLGCCGFAYADWKGSFYEAGAAAADYLPAYASAFPAVEVDSTFYGPPSEATVTGWAAKVPGSFRFALKVPKAVTHEKKLHDARGDFDDFVSVTEGLGKKRGPLLLQFPRFSTADFEDAAEFRRVLDGFLDGVDRSLRLAVEVRNPRWLDDDLLDLLRDHGAAAALTDQAGGLPDGGPASRFITSDFVYVRLLGERARIDALTKSWDATVIDRTTELRAWARFLADASDAIPDGWVWAFANNHLAGHAPASVRKLMSLLDAGSATP